MGLFVKHFSNEKMNDKIQLSFLVLAVHTVVGCQPANENPSGVQIEPVPIASISLETVDREGYDAVLHELTGNVVLVDFWATWCIPCIESFPHTVELSNRYQDEGLRVFSLSLDEPENGATVKQFLADQGATFRNLISQFGGSVQSMDAFEVGEGIPHYKLYDRRGKLRHTYSGASPEITRELHDRVEELLHENAD